MQVQARAATGLCPEEGQEADGQGEGGDQHDLVEKERGNLGTANLTKVTLETFVTWKRKKLQQKADAEKKDKVKLNDFSGFVWRDTNQDPDPGHTGIFMTNCRNMP